MQSFLFGLFQPDVESWLGCTLETHSGVYPFFQRILCNFNEGMSELLVSSFFLACFSF
jgi:hypothetical protein